MDFAKLWPTITMILTTVLAQFAAPIEAFVGAHPTLAMVAGSLAVLVANMVHSPTQPKV